MTWPATVPVVEAADDAHTGGVRGPDGETRAANPQDLDAVRAEGRVDVPVRAFAEQVKVDLAERCGESIGILAFVRIAVRQLDAKPVTSNAGRHHRRVDAGVVNTLHRGEHLAACIDHRDRLRLRLQRAHDSPVAGPVHAKDRERVVVNAVCKRADRVRVCRCIGSHVTHRVHQYTASRRHPR